MASRAAKKVEQQPKLRVKNEPPTMEEAMIAAACIADDTPQQIEIAAALMGLPLDAATRKALSAAKPRGDVVDITVHGRAQRSVVVERKKVLRPMDRMPVAAVRTISGQLRLNRG